MPPWDIRGPDIYVIGTGNNFTTPGPTTTTSSTTTSTTEMVTTAMYHPTTEQEPANVTLLLGQLTTETLSSMTICEFIVKNKYKFYFHLFNMWMVLHKN